MTEFFFPTEPSEQVKQPLPAIREGLTVGDLQQFILDNLRARCDARETNDGCADFIAGAVVVMQHLWPGPDENTLTKMCPPMWMILGMAGRMEEILT